MKPPPFRYHAPERLEDLLELLDGGDDEIRVLAGGQSLVPVMNFRLARPDALVDLNRVDSLRYVRRTADGRLAVGAGTRQSDLIRDPRAVAGWALLVEGIRHIGHPQIRNRGTVCGSLAHHDPTAELPALALALDADLELASTRGRRELAAADFFVSSFETALEPDELLLEVSFAPPPADAGWSFREIARCRSGGAIVGAAVQLRRDGDGAIVEPRLVVFGAGARALRCSRAEQLAQGRRLDDGLLRDLAGAVAEEVDPVADLHATADYRREAAGTLVSRAVAESWERAR